MNREDWLNALTQKLDPLFAEQGVSLPKVYVSTGWPSKSATSGKQRRIGECWTGSASADGIPHIFVSPTLDGFDAAHVLVHELCHAAVGTEAGHKGPFARLAKGLGLTGKMTATVPGDILKARLNDFITEIGPYPHAKLNPSVGIKKQSTRLIKLECPDCGYTVRTTEKWIAVGLPTCVCGEGMERA